jgi:hypothetical protein
MRVLCIALAILLLVLLPNRLLLLLLLLLLLQSRFLLGLDGEHQEYADIDGDASLDEAWAAQQAQDAEDAYFDAD